MFAETASSHCNRTSRDSEMTFRDPVPRNRLEQSGEASQEIQRIVGTARDRSSFSHEPYRIGCARGANEQEEPFHEEATVTQHSCVAGRSSHRVGTGHGRKGRRLRRRRRGPGQRRADGTRRRGRGPRARLRRPSAAWCPRAGQAKSLATARPGAA
jgi:hypothetical protein